MINIGIGLSWAAEKVFSAATSIINAFKTRVLAIPAVFENGSFLNLELNWLNKINLLDNASLILTPNSYIANKIYSVIPNTTLGDFDSTRATIATRVNSSGLIENVLTGIPRIDYTDGDGSLLLEPQRTNLNTYSSTFTDASWNKVSITPVLNSTILSPNGTTDSYKISRASTSVNGYIGKTSTSTSNTIFTATVYAKLGDVSTNIGLRLQGSYPNRGDASFNLQTGTLIGVANGGTNADTSATIQSVGDGWYRCSVTTTFATSITNPTTLLSPTSLTSIGGFEAPDGALSNCYVWGAQLEVGSYVTSYIPTTTSTVTRVADTMSRNNIYTNGLITSAGGTWFLELNNNVLLVRDGFSYGIFINSSNIANGNGFNIRHSTTNLLERLRINKTTLGTDTALYTTLTNNIKVAIKWNETTADVFVNGIKVVSATAFTTTNMEFLNGTAQEVPKYIKSMMLFPTPLTDAECISLTTL